jgi:hypothetical protein
MKGAGKGRSSVCKEEVNVIQILSFYFFPMVQQPLVGLGLLIIEAS